MTKVEVSERTNGIPVPEEGTEEFAKMNKMAKVAIPVVLAIFTLGVLQQQTQICPLSITVFCQLHYRQEIRGVIDSPNQRFQLHHA